MLEYGADLSILNDENKKAVDYIENDELKKEMEKMEIQQQIDKENMNERLGYLQVVEKNNILVCL